MSKTIWENVKRRREPPLVKKFLRDLESGLFATPKSFDALSRYRTEQLKLDRSREALNIYYPENPLIVAFVKKYPQAKTQAVALNSFHPPLAKTFALRQLQLVEQAAAAGRTLDYADAFAQVEKEMQPRLQALTQQALGTTIPQLQLMQQEEEKRLREAAVALSEGKLPVNAR